MGPSGLGGDLFAHAVEVTDHVRAREQIERLLAESEYARAEAESARERTAALQALTGAVSSASTVGEVAGAIVAHAKAMLGAAGVVVARVSADGEHLDIVGASDMPDASRERWSRFPLGANAPLAEAARTGESIYLESREAWIARYPEIAPELDASGHQANVVVPLILEGRVFGALGAAFRAARVFTADERAAVLTVSRQCALALERARLFESERIARRAAESANRTKSDFLAVISHELRTPLNTIDGYAELMELGIHGPLTEDQRQDLARIRKTQRHLLGLINGVLDYARVEAGAVRYAVRDVAVDETLAKLRVTRCSVSARKTSHPVTTPDAIRDLTVQADPEKLQQIILNLLTNAIKFTEPGGRIDLACSAEGPSVRTSRSRTQAAAFHPINSRACSNHLCR